MTKKTVIVLLASLLIIQFIRPAKNRSSVLSPQDITQHFGVPDSVAKILKRSCYDCHSNNTVYPWYDNIQPVAWWLQYHVNHGKRGLNFSEFASYPADQQIRRLKSVSRLVREDDMPLDSYLWMHKGAALSPEEKVLLIQWADTLRMRIGDGTDVKKTN